MLESESGPIYVPVLKGKQGELGALSKIQPRTRSSILPLLELVPPNLDLVPPNLDEAAVVSDAIDRSAKKLSTVWGGAELIVDAGLLPVELDLWDGRGATAYAVAKIRSSGIKAIPVVRLSDSAAARADVRSLHLDYGCGVVVRLSLEDMDEDPEDVDAALTALLREIGIYRAEADLVLDLAVLQSDIAVRAGSRMVLDVLRELDRVDEWRRIVVTSGAFPADLSAVVPWAFGEFQRYDAALWDALRGRRRLPRTPLYGDYSIAYPLLTSGPPFPPAPQLRYTLADRWLVLKGKRNDPRGNEQFYDVCEAIAGHAEFAGVAMGVADARIADPREQGPGNGATWREIGTTHHLDFVVRRITSLGEP